MKMRVKTKRYVVFDCETTGLDYKSDRIRFYWCSGYSKWSNYRWRFYGFSSTRHFKPESVPIHGILKEGKRRKIVEAEVNYTFWIYQRCNISWASCVAFDIEMINQALDRLNVGTLKKSSNGYWCNVSKAQIFTLRTTCFVRWIVWYL